MNIFNSSAQVAGINGFPHRLHIFTQKKGIINNLLIHHSIFYSLHNLLVHLMMSPLSCVDCKQMNYLLFPLFFLCCFIFNLISCIDSKAKYGIFTRSQADYNSRLISRCCYRFTYEVSPVFVLMEEVLLKKMQGIVGWSDDEGDGLFCPGEMCQEVTAEIIGLEFI